MGITVKHEYLQAGDLIILEHGVLSVYDDAENSSSIPGLVRVETEAGALYLDPDEEIEIQERNE